MDERARLVNWLWEHNAELTDEQFAEGVRAALKAATEHPSTKLANLTHEEKQEEAIRIIATAPPDKLLFIVRLADVISAMTEVDK